MLAFVCLAIVWAAFLVPPMLRKHRDGRPSSSVVSFRRQLSTLERATPGTSLRPLQPYQPTPVVAGSGALTRSDVNRRRRDVLLVLAGLTAFSFLLVLVAPGAFTTLLFLGAGGALGAYVYALVQIRKRAEEASAKVRVLRPARSAHGSAPILAVRRSASN